MRIALLDTHTVLRDALKMALRAEGIDVIADAAQARGIYAALENQSPALVVSELFLGDTDLVSMVRDLRRRGLTLRTLALTSQDNSLFVKEALRCGVNGYVFKYERLAVLVEGIRIVAANGSFLSPAVRELAGDLSFPNSHDLPSQSPGLCLEKLSPREREVFFRIVQGDSSQKIAVALCISIKTVETHRLHINRKLGVHSPMELVKLSALPVMLNTKHSTFVSAGGLT